MKKRVAVPVVTVGGITTPQLAEGILADGKADFVAMGRPLMADPELPKKSLLGREDDIRPCTGCHNCLMEMHDSHFVGCDVNPRFGREARISGAYTAPAAKKVVVVGGGPAGMQAAITAADCGHQVVLMEKAPALGGILRIFDDDPVKSRLKAFKEYFVSQVGKREIDLRLDTEATPELVEAEHPDAVIAAVGSRHIVPPIPGVDRPNVVTAMEAHEKGAEIGRKVVVIGGNLTGCETALTMLAEGRAPTIVEMSGELHPSTGLPVKFIIDDRLSEGVNILTNAKCVAIGDGVVVAETPGGLTEIEADTVVVAVGMRSNFEEADKFRYCAKEFRDIGDCLRAATVRSAVSDGFNAARDL
jgi:NADPH-dependent 2,4-dienoyl-CoA reductase/sulfur reductase-like enzyme